MRTAIEREHEEVDSEITLSATTLLGIFFGLVLVCGVFFGFGYSTGRHGSDAANANTPTTAAPSPNTEPAASHTPKPSAMESLQAATTSKPNPTEVTESLDQDTTPDTTPSQPVAPAVKQTALTQAPASKPSAAALEAKPVSLPAAVSGGTFMVQIAAVTRSEDANALASALRQRGYTVIVRSESQDQLLHVQVGPFVTRDDAKVMRAKLLGDGYNAILKP
ncbi:MAG TPA: SPOR domain-containing protein [Alloacidobacterium sp.]|nr:SPOR domain-containing protein [Alloacidobacterium sp.]